MVYIVYYQGYNKFYVEEDNTFYYNGVQYTLTDSDIRNLLPFFSEYNEVGCICT